VSRTIEFDNLGSALTATVALAFIGLVFAFTDKFSLHSKRSSIYDKPEDTHEKLPETHSETA
jgi:hypothetical protein